MSSPILAAIRASSSWTEPPARVVALPRANGNAPRHCRALPHREVAAALGAIRRGEVHPPVGGVVRGNDRVDGGAGRRGARGALGRDRRRGGEVDDPRVEDEGRARVLRPAEHGPAPLGVPWGRWWLRGLPSRGRPAWRARTGAGAVPRIVVGISVENRRAAAPQRAGARVSASRGRRDRSRVLFERAVVDGGVRRPGGGRGGLPRPCVPESGRSGVQRSDLLEQPRQSSSGVERLRHAAIEAAADLLPSRAQRPFRGVPRAFRGNYGP